MRWYPELPWTLYDNLVRHVWAITLPRNPTVIIDLGAHLGYTAIYYALKYPGAQIYAVEADPVTFQKLVRNTRFFKRIHPIAAAMGSVDGETTFYRSESSLASSLTKTKKANIPVTVHMKRFDTLLKENGIQKADLVKFNMEGAEWDVFTHCDLSTIGSFIGEYHEDIVGRPLADFVKMFGTVEIRPLRSHRYICTKVGT